MKQPTIRILISDDVGIGKTIEAGLIVRELLDRGEIKRLAVLCPPPLAEQWQQELDRKFHIHCELVLASTVARLERGLGVGASLFEVYPFTIVSLDYIKSERHRAEFLRVCPECIIVDEAHTCASNAGTKALNNVIISCNSSQILNMIAISYWLRQLLTVARMMSFVRSSRFSIRNF